MPGPAEPLPAHPLGAIVFATHYATATHTYPVRMTSAQRPFDIMNASEWRPSGIRSGSGWHTVQHPLSVRIPYASTLLWLR